MSDGLKVTAGARVVGMGHHSPAANPSWVEASERHVRMCPSLWTSSERQQEP